MRATTALLMALAIACPATAQDRSQQPTFPAHFPADVDVVGYIPDLLPLMNAAISSPHMQWLLTETQLGRDSGMTPGNLRIAVAGVSWYVPSEIAFATSDEALAEMLEISRAGLLIGLASGAVTTGDEEALAKLHEQLKTSLRKFRMRGLDLWVNFRNPATVNSVFPEIITVIQALNGDGFVVDTSETHATISVRLGDLIEADLLESFLAELGAAPAEHPNLKEFGRILAKLQLVVSVSRTDTGLKIHVGPPQEITEPLDMSSKRLWEPTDALLFYSTWRSAEVIRLFAETNAIWESWKDTPVGAAARHSDEEDLLGDLTTINRYMAGSSTEGALRLTTTDDGLRLDSESVVPAAATPLMKTRLLQYLPGDVESYTVDSTRSIADHFAERLDDFENRLANNDLQYGIAGRTTQQEMTEALSRFYYGRLKDFRQLVKHDSYEIFTGPVSVLFSSGPPTDLDVQFELEGQPQRLQAVGIPSLQYAVLGRMADPVRGSTFIEDAWRSFLTGVLGDAPNQLTQTLDLGDGLKAAVLTSDWQKQTGSISFQAGDDNRPHTVVFDDGREQYLLFSTSLSLTRRLVGQHRASGGQLTPPRAEAPVIAFGSVKGRTWGKAFEMLSFPLREPRAFTVSGDFAEGFMRGMLQLDDIGAYMDDFVALSERVTEVRWVTTQQGNVQSTEGRVILAP